MEQLKGQATRKVPRSNLVEQESRIHRRITQRDKAGLLECFDLLGHFVYCHAVLQTGSPAAAEDLTEQAFVALWQQPEAFDPTHGPIALQLVRRMARPSEPGQGPEGATDRDLAMAGSTPRS